MTAGTAQGVSRETSFPYAELSEHPTKYFFWVYPPAHALQRPGGQTHILGRQFTAVIQRNPCSCKVLLGLFQQPPVALAGDGGELRTGAGRHDRAVKVPARSGNPPTPVSAETSKDRNPTFGRPARPASCAGPEGRPC